MLVIKSGESIRQHRASKHKVLTSPGIAMSVVAGISTALEVSGIKDYIGHMIGGLTGWLLEKAYRWWSGNRVVGDVERDIEQGVGHVHEDNLADDVEANLESTSLCIISEFGLMENDERVAVCCGWRFTASRDVHS